MDLPATPTDAGIDDHIRSVVGLSDQLLGQLRQSLQRIDEINRTTHVISMNARIESARIGHAGRGFSVIAQEMDVLSRRVADATQDLDKVAASTSADMRHTLQQLDDDVRRTRLSELALSNIDLIDRNLYERSCNVRWWATDAAIAAAAHPGRGDDALAYAARRMGQILESYTVYFDLVLAGTDGRILTNGQPQQYASAGSEVSAQAWFEHAMRTRSGEQFGFQGVHASTLADGERVLVYSCTVRDGGRVDGRVRGVPGIVFRWDALAQTLVQRTPLSEQEWGRSRVCIVDPHGQVLADSDGRMLQERIDFAGREALFKQPRGAVLSDLNGRPRCIAHAASSGYETYRTGWHSLILQAL
ncbi:methyl-accepting chemotaxis protein [Xanthomonas translucens]|uniref:methyl-accepting chemotaxis protein n=1 Tax=Xanthomonas campestris pv. translucens TaxID=343 RepID=UPI00071E7586|nr:methyl-accepting chemotaxis protein [Xanthomonas translucens]